MTIKQRDTWLGRKMESMSNEELMVLFEEISEFRETGILIGGCLRALAKTFSENVSKAPYGEHMMLIEDEVLYEISRRFYNEIILKSSRK